MINLHTLGALLRTLRDEPGTPGRPAALPIASVRGVARLADPGTDAPAARIAMRAMLPSPGEATAEPSEGAFAEAPPVDDGLRSRPTRAEPTSAGARRAPVAGSAPSARSADASSVPARSSPSVDLQLTEGAALITAALRVRGAQPLQPAVIDGAAPLADTRDAKPSEIADALRSRIAASGLFYESHLARHVAAVPVDGSASDARALDALRREPQAAWQASGAAPLGQEASARAATPGPAAIVERQLATLETRAIVYAGDVWPGQRATIEIAEDERRRSDDEPPSSTPAGWRSTIEIALPSLGTVRAQLALDGDRLSLRLSAASTAGRERLADGATALHVSLADARLTLATLVIDEGRDG